MCYEFEDFYTRARIVEQLRKKPGEQKQRTTPATPAKPAEPDVQIEPQDPVPA
jgi:hypothetical protein